MARSRASPRREKSAPDPCIRSSYAPAEIFTMSQVPLDLDRLRFRRAASIFVPG